MIDSIVLTTAGIDRLTLPQINVLCNMTEVVIRRIEQAWAVNIAKAHAQQRLSRALSAYETPLLFVDAGEEGRNPPQAWNIMYLNDSACTALGALCCSPESPEKCGTLTTPLARRCKHGACSMQSWHSVQTYDVWNRNRILQPAWLMGFRYLQA